MKKLKLQRETVRVLNHIELGNAHGGAGSVVSQNTSCCPIQSAAICSGGGCVETIGGGTIVINPPPISIRPGG